MKILDLSPADHAQAARLYWLLGYADKTYDTQPDLLFFVNYLNQLIIDNDGWLLKDTATRPELWTYSSLAKFIRHIGWSHKFADMVDKFGWRHVVGKRRREGKPPDQASIMRRINNQAVTEIVTKQLMQGAIRHAADDSA